MGSYLILTIFGIHFCFSKIAKNIYLKLAVVVVPAFLYFSVSNFKIFHNQEYPFPDFHPFLISTIFLVFVFDILGGSRVKKSSYLLLPLMFLSSNPNYHAFVVSTFILVLSSPVFILKVLAHALMFTSVASAITQQALLSEVFVYILLLTFAFYSYFTVSLKDRVGEELIVSLALLHVFTSFISTNFLGQDSLLVLTPYVFVFLLVLRNINTPAVTYLLILILFGVVFLSNISLGFYLPILILLLRFCFCDFKTVELTFLSNKLSPQRFRSIVIIMIMLLVFYFTHIYLGSSWVSVFFIFMNLVLLLNINKFFESTYLSDLIACALLLTLGGLCLL